MHAGMPRMISLKYKVYKIDGAKLEQKEPWFLAINPNGRIPALTDTIRTPDGEKREISLFESGSIMQYLVETYDQEEYRISYPPGTPEHFETNNWLFFQNAGVGPMQGQANHFLRYAPQTIDYAVDRYVNEVKRLYQVLDRHLAGQEKKAKTMAAGAGGYIVGDGSKCTIADIAHWGWVCLSLWAGVDLEEFPALKAWEDRMARRPALERGRHVPEPHTHKEILKDKAKMAEMMERGKKFAAASTKHTAETRT